MTPVDVLAERGSGSLLVFGFIFLLGFVCFGVAAGLRLARRGAARFWIGPALTALALLPGVVSLAAAATAWRRVLEERSLTGSGGVAAVAGGSAESMLPLVVGFGCTAALASWGLLLVAAGSSRVEEGFTPGSALGSLASMLFVGSALGLLALHVTTIHDVNAGWRDPGALLLRWQVTRYGSLGLAALLVGHVLVTALGAPRGAASTTIKLTSLACLVATLVGAIVGLAVVYRQVDALTQSAASGTSQQGSPTASPATVPSTPEASASPAGQAPLQPSEFREPKKIRHVPPVYPESARRARVQGVVILQCSINPDGRVSDVTVISAASPLDSAAVDAVRQWVYEPTLRNGVAVPVIATVKVSFKLS